MYIERMQGVEEHSKQEIRKVVTRLNEEALSREEDIQDAGSGIV
jgi:hypothetical protein